MSRRLFQIRRSLRRAAFDWKYRNAFRHQEFDTTLRCDNHLHFSFGKRCYIGPGCHFDALGGIHFDDFVIVGPYVRIWSYNHDFQSPIIPYGGENRLAPVRVGKGCWLGIQTLILPGADIGEGTVVAAGSIVRGTIPPFSLVRPAYSEFQPLQVLKQQGVYYRDRK
jgi:acetyltransferase-like isoleucine patch superfamily enzyme